jgi:twitching motility protein PilT
VLNFELPKFLGAIMAAAPRAGDVLLAVGAPPQVQIEGTLVPLRMAGLERLSPFQTETVMLHLLAGAPAAAARVRANGAAHFSYSLSAITRFRVAVFSQRGTFAISLRTIPFHIPALAELNLPEVMREACAERTGVVLVNGPAGAGRTTTLAALIAELNTLRPCHVVTVEDPLEFLHRHAAATVNQREAGTDTPTLAQGLADALRQAADVIVVSEVSGVEEARLVLEAAETGHLVFTELRGFDTASSVARFLNFFSTDERPEARARLARVLRWSFTQHLLPHREARRPVVEVWRATRASLAHLAEAPLDSQSMADLLRDSEKDGLVGFDRELERRVRAGDLDLELALSSAVLRRQLELRLLDVRESGS